MSSGNTRGNWAQHDAAYREIQAAHLKSGHKAELRTEMAISKEMLARGYNPSLTAAAMSRHSEYLKSVTQDRQWREAHADRMVQAAAQSNGREEQARQRKQEPQPSRPAAAREKPQQAANGNRREQEWHDKAYAQVMASRLHGAGKWSVSVRDEVEVSKTMLKHGADKERLAKTLESHSLRLKDEKPGPRQKAAEAIVARADMENREDVGREERQNVKPGHEQHRPPEAPAWMQDRGRSR